MTSLTSGRTEPCKDSQGGIKEVWLASFVDYSVQVIQGYKDMLLTSFPTTLFYQYEGREQTFNEVLNDQGGYDQEIFLKLRKQSFEDVALLETLVKKSLRAVVVDNLGKIRVAGLHNGMDADLTAKAGGSRFDFNGYELKLTGVEPFSAPYLSAFPGTGFLKTGVTLSCLMASSDRPASLSDKVSSCSVVQ